MLERIILPSLGFVLVPREQKKKTKGESFSLTDIVNGVENVNQCNVAKQFLLPCGVDDEVLQVRDHPDHHLQLRRHEHGRAPSLRGQDGLGKTIGNDPHHRIMALNFQAGLNMGLLNV